MIVYKTSGILGNGITWEDFVADGDAPSVTIEVDEILLIDGPGADGWFDALVPSDYLTESAAKLVLSLINNVAPSDIVIEQAGVCLSI